MLPLLPPNAAGGSEKPASSWVVFALAFPEISVEGAGVGGKLGRGMMVRVLLLMERSGKVETDYPASERGSETSSRKK